MFDEGLETTTSRDQVGLEDQVAELFSTLQSLTNEELAHALTLRRQQHIEYTKKGLGRLSGSFVSLDASRPWIVYWCLHSLALLGEDTARLTAPGLVDIAAFLRSCQHPDGGFGGGPGQIAHTATTYASVAALATLGPKAVGHLDRASLRRFLERMCVPRDRGGGMTVHDGGEVDIRACYTAVASGVLAGIDVAFMEERAGIGEYIARCQTAEGGIGGEPGNEAHGGYTYCGLACAALLGTAQMLDLRRLAHWCAWQQAAVEGGLRGRTNKLADGCYTFWQGSIPALLRRVGADIMRQSPVPRAPGAAGGGGAAEAWRAAECALRDVHVGEVGLDQQAETHLMGIGERGGAQAVERAKRDVSRCDVNAAELFAECAARCSAVMPSGCPSGRGESEEIFDAAALQGWVLVCCQMENGGLRDKPGKGRDFYHTCYCLSGLSQAQHTSGMCLGPGTNLLVPADPALNVVEHKLAAMLSAWDAMDP